MFYILKKDVSAKATIVKRGNSPCLLADFYTSSPQLIWQLNLKKTSNFILMLKQDEQGEWDLGYETDKAPFKNVAHFDERGDAEDSYAIVQKAIDRGEIKLRHRILRGSIYIALFLIAFNFINMALFSDDDPQVSEIQIGQSEVAPTSGKPRIVTGVPVAADDVLPSNPY